LYGDAPPDRARASFAAAPLAPLVNRPARRYERTPEHELVRPAAGAAPAE
jgi:hypothetical protein